jgi:hypothetical protein
MRLLQPRTGSRPCSRPAPANLRGAPRSRRPHLRLLLAPLLAGQLRQALSLRLAAPLSSLAHVGGGALLLGQDCSERLRTPRLACHRTHNVHTHSTAVVGAPHHMRRTEHAGHHPARQPWQSRAGPRVQPQRSQPRAHLPPAAAPGPRAGPRLSAC